MYLCAEKKLPRGKQLGSALRRGYPSRGLPSSYFLTVPRRKKGSKLNAKQGVEFVLRPKPAPQE